MQRPEASPTPGAAAEGAPRSPLECDICVIGAGSGGLSVAAAAAAFGERVVLVEKHKMGGDCLNYGCVPSKALLAAARRAHAFRTSAPFGVRPVEPEIDHGAVHDHVQQVIAAIAPNDSTERFTGLGVRVIHAAAMFLDSSTVAAGEDRIEARYFVIATGSSAAVPPIPGLATAGYLTNETIFANRQRLDHLIVVGGGPIGLEMAQAHRRLGSRVTVLEAERALAKEDPELSAVVLAALRREGVDVREGTTVERVEGGPGAVRVIARQDRSGLVVDGSHILVATGRRPTTEGLGLEAAGVQYTRKGVTVGPSLVTTNPKVFAIGDCAGGPQFTHVANDHAGVVIRRALFKLPAKAAADRVPRVTYTEPELAHVGLTEDEARRAGHRVAILRWPCRENDRAQAEHSVEGFAKIVVGRRGKILGASIVSRQAGELIGMWTLAISQGLGVKAMTEWIAPYPTLSEINKRAAYRRFAAAASSPIVRRVVGLLKVFG